MAMTKKEQAAYQAALEEIRILEALRWTTAVEKDIPPPQPFEEPEYINGWIYNAYSGTVQKAWSSSIYHGDGWVENKERPRHASQRPQALYSSALKAWQGLRYDVERSCARRLAEIDKQIHRLTQTPMEE